LTPIESKHKLESFDAVVLLAERGLIDYDAYWKTINRIMGYSVVNHMLGKTGLAELRKELQDLPALDPWSTLLKIRSPLSDEKAGEEKKP